MKLQALSSLSAVLRLGSFAAAAEHVNLTPSAISLQMKQLETYLGQPLFDRSGRKVRPTGLALELVRSVDRTLSEVEALRSNRGLAPAGRVRLGITESALSTLLPPAFAELRQRAPGVDLQIERGSTPELLDALKAGRIDMAVLIRPPTGGSSRLHWTDLLAEPLVLVVPRELPEASAASILRTQPWIRFDRRLVAGQMAARYVDTVVPQRTPLVDVPSIDAIVAMVGLGMGVSVLPQLRPDHLQTHAVRVIGLGRSAPVRQMALVRRGQDAENRLIGEVERAFMAAVGRSQVLAD